MTENAEVADDEKLDDMVEKYLQAKDALALSDAAHKQKTARVRQWMEDQLAAVLVRLKELGADNIRTRAGTAYRSTVRSATLADPAAFRDFVAENEAWDLVDMKANAPAVKAWIDEHEALPPGVNFGETIVARVRRSN